MSTEDLDETKNSDKKTFMNHVFRFDQETKFDLINLSQYLREDSLCATIIIVIFWGREDNESMIDFSVSESNALVASSRNKTSAFL